MGILILACGLLYLVGSTAVGFNGYCGGLMPFLAGPHPCSFVEYMQNNLSLTLGIAVLEFWWVIALILLIPACIG